jgi:hypothetical protein
MLKNHYSFLQIFLIFDFGPGGAFTAEREYPDPWNLMRIIPTEERGMNNISKITAYMTAGPS